MTNQTYTVLAQTTAHRGFQLKKPASLTGPVSVLVGRNGSGKTRFLQSLTESKFTEASANALDVRVQLFSNDNLQPNFGDDFQVGRHEDDTREFIKSYESWKIQAFREPYERHEEGIGKYQPTELKRISRKIGLKVGKKFNELSAANIENHFEQSESGPFAKFDISGAINKYILRKQKNDIERLRSIEDKTIEYLTPEQFIAAHGQQPWKTLNNLVSRIFGGKFSFAEPDLASRLFDFRLTLLEGGEQRKVHELSRGEQILLWLMLTLFQASTPHASASRRPSLYLFDEPDAFLHPKMVLEMYKVFVTVAKAFDVNFIITTHSPTTAALASDDALYLVDDNTVSSISKDQAVAQLLDGVPHISIDPENRRQVFVESFKDAEVYRILYEELKHSGSKIDPSISLTFVPSGPKHPERTIIESIKKHIPGSTDDQIKNAVEMINGIGCSSQVVAQVEELVKANNKTSRGIIDWDKMPGQQQHPEIQVIGRNLFYSIENWGIDPIACKWYLHTLDPDAHPLDTTNPRTKISTWLNDEKLLQNSLDEMIVEVYGRPSNHDAKINYVNGFNLLSDKIHTESHGHDVVYESFIKRYQSLKKLESMTRTRDLSCAIAMQFMVQASEGKLIPSAVADCFSNLQVRS